MAITIIRSRHHENWKSSILPAIFNDSLRHSNDQPFPGYPLKDPAAVRGCAEEMTMRLEGGRGKGLKWTRAG
jgi:hypothetical protein